MQSSYNIIKNKRVINQGNKEIITVNMAFEEPEKEMQVLEEQKEEQEENAKVYIESYENLAKNILEKARRQGEDIIAKAYVEAQEMEQDAYSRGYELGKSRGYEDGYKAAYEPTMEEATLQGNQIKEEATAVLFQAKELHIAYFQAKEKEIRNLVLTTVESVLKREVQNVDGMNAMIFDALSIARKSSTFIIKCNGFHLHDLKNKIEIWKEQLTFKGEIFVLEDSSLEVGTAWIEKENGKLIVGVELALDKIKEIICSEV